VRKIFAFLITVFAFLFLLTKPVLADGFIIEPDPYSGRWDWAGEANQQAYISHDGHLQKMIISIGLNKPSLSQAVWIFPVPASPKKTVIDVVDRLPYISGEEISQKTEKNLDDTQKILLSTQIYPLPFLKNKRAYPTMNSDMTQGAAPSGERAHIERDVVVHEHLEKKGITSEIVTAKTANGLYNYLKDKGLSIKPGSIPVLNHYIGKDYSFVASWIGSMAVIMPEKQIKQELSYYLYSQYELPKFKRLLDKLKQKYPELAQIYTDYNKQNQGQPLMHSPNKPINPVEFSPPRGNYIEVEDLVERFLLSKKGKPVLDELVKAIQEDPSIVISDNSELDLGKQRGLLVTFPTEKMYYPLLPTSVYGSETVPATLRVIGHITPEIFSDIKSYTKVQYYLSNEMYDAKSFYNGQKENAKYTKIKINAPSKYLTQDLWIERQTPVKTQFIAFLAANSLLVSLGLYAFISVVVGIFIGMILFPNLRKNIFKLAILGLANCLSILGLVVATVILDTKNTNNEEAKAIVQQLKEKGYVWKRRLVTGVVLAAILPVLLLIFGLFNVFSRFYYPGIFEVFNYGFKGGLILLAPIVILVFVLKEIRNEDKGLFTELKRLGYSTWTFQPKNSRKIIFVPLYSLTFVVMSIWAIKLIKLFL
jgi:hypothetical protein